MNKKSATGSGETGVEPDAGGIKRTNKSDKSKKEKNKNEGSSAWRTNSTEGPDWKLELLAYHRTSS